MLIFSYIKMYLNCFKSSVKVNPCPTSGASGAYSEIRLGGGKTGILGIEHGAQNIYYNYTAPPRIVLPPTPSQNTEMFWKGLIMFDYFSSLRQCDTFDLGGLDLFHGPD